MGVKSDGITGYMGHSYSSFSIYSAVHPAALRMHDTANAAFAKANADATAPWGHSLGSLGGAEH